MGSEHAQQLDIGKQQGRETREAPPPVPGRETRTEHLAAQRAQVLARLVDTWRAAGLLDPPARPATVGAFPAIGAPATGVVHAGAAAASAARALADEVERPRPRLVPNPEPEPAPKAIPPALLAFAVFVLVLLWPNETAPAWLDESNPITGAPYGSEEEYRWTWSLSEPQRTYLRFLLQARELEEDANLDGESDPLAVPLPKPQEPDGEQCESRDVKRRGGHKVHDAYATKVTHSPNDFFVRSGSDAINYDGLELGTRFVWEVKTGYMWFFNDKKAHLTKQTLARWEIQRVRGVRIAAACNFIHRWAHPDKHMVDRLNTMWRGVPPVSHVPL